MDNNYEHRYLVGAMLTITRLPHNPIIVPHMDARMGSNINGPSMIKTPEWLSQRLGRYYLYFAHHDGHYIRLAYANDIAGPWRMHEPGVLPLQESTFADHIASPDAHVDHQKRQIRLYFHGADTGTSAGGEQSTRVALSADGLNFTAHGTDLGGAYFRVFRYHDWYYALVMPGLLLRSQDGLANFVSGPQLFSLAMRHSAVFQRNNQLLVAYSNVGDKPEHIRIASVLLDGDWHTWRPGPTIAALKPEHPYEGANETLTASVRGIATEPKHELRDPAFFASQEELYLLYSVAGEHGIAIAHLTNWEPYT